MTRRLFYELPNHGLRFGVGSFAEVLVADDAVLVDEVLGGPVAVVEGVPGVEVVVLHNGPGEAVIGNSLPDVVNVMLELELRGVDADDNEAIVGVLRMPNLEVGKGAYAVDAGVGPEVYEDYIAAQFFYL